MAGIVILGVAAVVEAVHSEIADRRSPIICLNSDFNVVSTSPPSSTSPVQRLFALRGRRSSDASTTSSSNVTHTLAEDATPVTITKRALKRLTFDWDGRAAELQYRIREIERHYRATGATRCWAGYHKDLPAMREALVEAKEIRHRLVDAIIYLKHLPDGPLRKTSLNPVHRRPKDVLPVTLLPPSLNGLPVPLPRPPRSTDFRPVLEKDLPGYADAMGSEGGDVQLAIVTEEEEHAMGRPPTYEPPTYDEDLEARRTETNSTV